MKTHNYDEFLTSLAHPQKFKNNLKRVAFFGSISPTFIDKISTAAKFEPTNARNKL